MEADSELAAFAQAQGYSAAAARALVDTTRARVHADWFYVFWLTGGGAAAGRTARARTLLAFSSPDAALAFAQRNQIGRGAEPPRLRRLSLPQLLLAVLREPSIAALLIAEEADDTPLPAGRLPGGVKMERAALLRQLQGYPP